MANPSIHPRRRVVTASLIGIAVGGAFAALTTQVAPPTPSEGESPVGPSDLRAATLDNLAAYIPPQCYTNTEATPGQITNPCYTCHVTPRAPNFVDDSELQFGYTFAKYARENRWSNLFEDRSAAMAQISDEAITAYVRTSNYLTEDGTNLLAAALAQPPAQWDHDGDGRWAGYVPDAHYAFDAEGFDRDPGGAPTGWRAFAYYPTPGTFWPTNGATSDVLIRLASVFRDAEPGRPDLEVYRVNLAIVEALIKRADVEIEAVDEGALGVDLDQDGSLATATRVKYGWAPLKGRTMSYVGAARKAQAAGEVHLAAGLFPEGTEFLHTVRYIDARDDGRIELAPRLKELRYAKKTRWRTYSELEAAAARETKEKSDFPDRLRQPQGTWTVERGIVNGKGWVYQGFIEDAQGDLRPQSFEEHVFCTGCHGGIRATDDTIFSFARKLDAEGPQGGWFHWSQHSLAGLPERKRGDGQGEYALYLRTNHAGDELRANEEVIERFFSPEGSLRPTMVSALGADVSVLLEPSPARARALNKAYRTIVMDQDFTQGRDATISPAVNVHRRIEEDQQTGVEVGVPPSWRVRTELASRAPQEP